MTRGATHRELLSLDLVICLKNEVKRFGVHPSRLLHGCQKSGTVTYVFSAVPLLTEIDPLDQMICRGVQSISLVMDSCQTNMGYSCIRSRLLLLLPGMSECLLIRLSSQMKVPLRGLCQCKAAQNENREITVA